MIRIILISFLLTSCGSAFYSPHTLKKALPNNPRIAGQMWPVIDTLYNRQVEAFDWPPVAIADSTAYRDSVLFARTAVEVGEWMIAAYRTGQFYANRKVRGRVRWESNQSH